MSDHRLVRAELQRDVAINERREARAERDAAVAREAALRTSIEALAAEWEGDYERCTHLRDLRRALGEVPAGAGTEPAESAHERVTQVVGSIRVTREPVGTEPDTEANLENAPADFKVAEPDTEPRCGCARWAAIAHDPTGCYCTCAEDGRDGCEHDPDAPRGAAEPPDQPTQETS